jgi:hypothetical protein
VLTILLTIPIGLMFLVITLYFPSMRYEIEENHLILTMVLYFDTPLILGRSRASAAAI